MLRDCVAAGVLQVSSRLDASLTSVYSLCVTAADGQHDFTVEFNVTVASQSDDADGDLAVQFSQPVYVFDVMEDAPPGVTVGRVQALVDVVGLGASTSPLNYAITSRWPANMFQLNATYGILTLASTLDHETVSRCSVL